VRSISSKHKGSVQHLVLPAVVDLHIAEFLWRISFGASSLFVFSFLRASSSSDPQHEVDDNGKQQCDRQYSRAKAIVESTLSSHANALCAPVECYERVDHRHQRDKCEESGANLSDAVAEVEEANGKATEDDGEVEP
jgi:hypothetical protein